MNIPINILALIFVLSFLIVFHEGGHFVIAKLFKFPVEVFSLGFGKRLFGWKRKETDYRVSLIPLGGYVKVVGLGPDESDIVSGTAEAAQTVPGSRMQRLLILVERGGLLTVIAKLLLCRRDACDLFRCRRVIKPGAFAGGQRGGEIGLGAAVFLYA